MSSSTTASRYADYESACPRSQQIIHTIDVTFQQGIFIYDLTFIQQELESVLIGAIERQNQLLQTNGDDLKLPMSSMVRLANGKKPRDFKAERERRRKAFNGHPSRKRRMKKKSSTINLLKNFIQEKNGHSTENHRTSVAHRTMTTPSENHRNGHFAINQIFSPDQFWSKIIDLQHDYLKKTDWNYLEKLIEIDQNLLENFDQETYNDLIHTKEYLLTNEKYIHPELVSSIVIKQNTHFYRLIDRLSNNHRLKRKSSSLIENDNIMDIDHSIGQYLERDIPKFSSKYTELQYRLQESLLIERLAQSRAEQQTKLDEIRFHLSDIDEKILEITNSIRQRKRPSENAISLCKTLSPTPMLNLSNEDEAWRKGRRQSTLRIYDELARLIDERFEYDKQLIDTYPTISSNL